MKPYISFRGVRTNVSLPVFISLFLTFLTIGFAIMWCVVGGVFKFAGWTGLLAFVLLTIEITTTSRKFAVIPWDGVRAIVNFVICMSAFVYFWI